MQVSFVNEAHANKLILELNSNWIIFVFQIEILQLLSFFFQLKSQFSARFNIIKVCLQVDYHLRFKALFLKWAEN
jgi:hypothetical protein